MAERVYETQINAVSLLDYDVDREPQKQTLASAVRRGRQRAHSSPSAAAFAAAAYLRTEARALPPGQHHTYFIEVAVWTEGPARKYRVEFSVGMHQCRKPEEI